MRVVTERSNHPSNQPPPHHAATTRRIYVVDTSVLLADPGALGRFDEHEVVLPLAVISELEAKRHHPDLGWAARRAIRHLEDIRRAHGRLDEAVLADVDARVGGRA